VFVVAETPRWNERPRFAAENDHQRDDTSNRSSPPRLASEPGSFKVHLANDCDS
jgi:hypothetical protein